MSHHFKWMLGWRIIIAAVPPLPVVQTTAYLLAKPIYNTKFCKAFLKSFQKYKARYPIFQIISRFRAKIADGCSPAIFTTSKTLRNILWVLSLAMEYIINAHENRKSID